MKKSVSKNLKIASLVGASLIVFGTIATTLSAHNYQTTSITSQTSNLTFWDNHKQYLQHPLGLYCNDNPNGGDIISPIQIEDHINAINTKLAAKLNALGASEADVQEQCGKFLANVNSYLTPVDVLTNTTVTLQDKLNNKYSYVNQQAEALGVEVMDFDAYIKTIIPQTNTEYVNALIQGGDSIVDAQRAADEITNIQMTQILPVATSDLYSTIQMGVAFGTDVTTPNAKTTMLKTILGYADSIYGSDLIAIQTENFIPFLKAYSSSGKYQEGDEIEPSDLQYLFNYKYDLVANAAIGHYVPAYDFNEPTVPGSYDDALVTTITQPLTSLENYQFGNYGQDEIIPGFKLHVKICQEDVVTNSHQCELTLQFGIEETNSHTLIWDDMNQQFNDMCSRRIIGDNNQTPNIITLPVQSSQYIKYVSANTYYAGDFPSQAIVNDAKIIPDSNNVYFQDSKAARPYLDVIMGLYDGKYKGNDYDLQDYPIYLQDPTYWNLIPFPTNLQSSWLTQSLHTNQTLALRVTDINETYGQESLNCNWCMIDKNSDTTIDVHDFVWNINGKNIDTIKIAYEMSPQLEVTIDVALALVDLENILYAYKQDISALNGDPTTINNKLQSIITIMEVSTSLQLAISAIVTTLLIGYVILAITVPAMGPVVVLAIAAIAATAVYVVNAIICLKNDESYRDTISILTTYLQSTWFAPIQKFYDDIYKSGDVDKISDPRCALGLKQEAAKNIINSFDTNLGNDFTYTLTQILNYFARGKGLTDPEIQFLDSMIQYLCSYDTIMNISAAMFDAWFSTSEYASLSITDLVFNYFWPYIWKEYKGDMIAAIAQMFIVGMLPSIIYKYIMPRVLNKIILTVSSELTTVATQTLSSMSTVAEWLATITSIGTAITVIEIIFVAMIVFS